MLNHNCTRSSQLKIVDGTVAAYFEGVRRRSLNPNVLDSMLIHLREKCVNKMLLWDIVVYK